MPDGDNCGLAFVVENVLVSDLGDDLGGTTKTCGQMYLDWKGTSGRGLGLGGGGKDSVQAWRGGSGFCVDLEDPRPAAALFRLKRGECGPNLDGIERPEAVFCLAAKSRFTARLHEAVEPPRLFKANGKRGAVC